MRKTVIIAIREYSAAVRTKAFLISLILLPIMMGGSAFMQVLTKKYGADIKERKIAVLDRTPGAALFEVLKRSADDRNKTRIFDEDSGKQIEPVFTLIPLEAATADDPGAIDRQRYELSEQIRKGELFAFIELGKKMLDTPSLTKPPPASSAAAPATTQTAGGMSIEKLSDDYLARYTSNSPTYTLPQQWAQRALINAVYARRFARFANIPQEQMLALMIPPAVLPKPMARLADGKVNYEMEQNQVVNFVLPIALIFLMFVIVLVGSSPMTMNVMEEKQLRIAEVLLGSVRPFELMMGKLLGGVGVALTLAGIYFIGAYWAAKRYDFAQYVSPQLLLWFIAFCVVAVFMYGSLFVAVGSAVNNAKEAQSLITPIMVLVVLPMMVLGQLLQSPSGPIGMVFTFFPPSAPMVTVARMAIPPGIPTWQPVVSLLITLVTTIIFVWCAGRIFRVGLLMQGQGAKLGQMLRWVMKG